MGAMSELDLYRQTIEAITNAMADEPVEIQVEYRLDCLLRELDEMCALAANPETVGIIDANRITIGQIKTRVDLIASFLMAREPNFKVIGRG